MKPGPKPKSVAKRFERFAPDLQGADRMRSYPYQGEDFCIVHGREHMRSQMGNPIPFCEACESERSQTG